MLAGDATGYVWGQRNERTEVPIENSRDRQTYYGGLNLYNQQFFIKPYPTGNGENTIAFLKDLQAAYPNKKLIILWDNARYHTGKEVKKYLNEVNGGITDEKDRKLNCYHFAPNAPDQNPVEDVWLRGSSRSDPLLGQSGQSLAGAPASDGAFEIAPRGLAALAAGIDDAGEQGHHPRSDPGAGPQTELA